MLVTLNFNIFNSYSDCETCGSYSNIIVTVKSETHDGFGEYSTGSYANCFDVDEADYPELIEEVFKRLENIEIFVPRPVWKLHEINEELECRYNTEIIERGLLDIEKYPSWDSWPSDVNWDLYWEYNSYKENIYEEKYYTFYENSMDLTNPHSFVSYLKLHGIQVIVEFAEDEQYDIYDDHDEYYSELFDNGYTTDESYEDDYNGQI